MPLSALPEGFKETADNTNTDWNNPIQRYWKKSWFAYGPRATEWWAKWREIPKVLFAIHGKGPWRWEYTNAEGATIADYEEGILTDPGLSNSLYYLSVIQYWTRWHFAVQWPFHITFHFYFREKDRQVYPSTDGSKADNKLFFFRFGARRDADKVYWFPSVFAGLTWN